VQALGPLFCEISFSETMELKEWIAIFRKHARAFWGTVGVFVVAGGAWYLFQPQHSVADLTLNVTRRGSQETESYKYDDFYRLQADERFADTVVRWLGSPRVVSDIYEDAGMDTGTVDLRGLAGAFSAERLSSQMIRVRYRAQDAESARALSRSLLKIVTENIETLNKEQREKAWFKVVGDEPVVRDGKTSLSFSLEIALVAGVLLGFWVVLLRHYFAK
jgi:uncharacterized protein involved in exopolysaccharide biosynthesis